MKAFWWLKENAIAGMARPGFNFIKWSDMPFDEAVLFGWLGLNSSGAHPVAEFRKHFAHYAPRIYKFHKHDDVSGPKALALFNEDAGVADAMDRLMKRTCAIERFDVKNGILNFDLSSARLGEEIHFLKTKGVKTVVTLTEKHHSKSELQEHFGVHHFSIPDLGAPKLQQALELAKILKSAREKKETVAVHCLAGIGRTSTMLAAAHVALGENAAEMETWLRKQNPAFALTGEQRDFVFTIASKL